jgi:hypothetical protein
VATPFLPHDTPEPAGDCLAREQHVLGEWGELDEQDRADGPKEAEREDRVEYLVDVHCPAHEIDRSAQPVPV